MLLLKLLPIYLCFHLNSCTEYEVLQLGDDDFDQRIAEHSLALVMFYAPWCGHCKLLKPEFSKAAQSLLNNNPPITLLKVDCTESGKETCDKNEVKGYPTLKIFRDGEFSQNYEGTRESEGIIKYMINQLSRGVVELKTTDSFKTFVEGKYTSVVGFFEKDSDFKTVFFIIASKFSHKYRFAYVSNKEMLKEGINNGIILYRSVIFRNKFEDDKVEYKGNGTKIDIANFIKNNARGLVGHRTADNLEDFPTPLVVAYYNIDYARNLKVTNYWRNRVLKVAREFVDKINFAVSDKVEFQSEFIDVDLEEIDKSKPIIMAKDEKEHKYLMTDDFSIENITIFVEQLLEGKLEPYIMSEPIPETNDGPVLVAVAKNFEDVVINNNKDTLVEFYAPWCGHCKQLAPVYDEVGEKLKNEDVAIVKMNAKENEIPRMFEIPGYPTIYWLPRDSKKSPVAYEGGRDIKDFIGYIAKHATNPLKGYDRDGNPVSEKTEL